MKLEETLRNLQVTGDKKGQYIINIPAAFDIETSSFYNPNKTAVMYCWQLQIDSSFVFGREWEDFVQTCKEISSHLNLSYKKRLVIYVHNLAYEFQFMRKHFNWVKVFSIEQRKPVYAITDLGIEFRCSYILSGYNLEVLAKNLKDKTYQKLVGELDYNKVRHTQTPLTEQELEYCKNDVRIVVQYIRELISEYGSISNLPLTNTGFVRKYVRSLTVAKKNWHYIDLIHSLNITPEELKVLKRAFIGGFTHANAEYVQETLENVSSYDFTSSYPAVMVSEKFPMSSGVKIQPKDIEHFRLLTQKYCCVFDIEFTNIRASRTNDNPISESKCFICENPVVNNGRIVCASRIATTITNIDFDIYEQFYSWDSLRVGEMYCYKQDYLPTEFIYAILKLYSDKTTLKGVKGKETEYLRSKGMLNSCYGMCVTDPIKELIEYNDSWDKNTHTTSDDSVKSLNHYNKSKNRFLFYPWGVFITAYARKNLFTAIHYLGDDYVYADTDSVKLLNHEKYKSYFEAYNKLITYKLAKATKHHNLDLELVSPKNLKGEIKPLGVWDYEGTYERFKTLGAKRYLTQNNGTLELTASGVSKSMGAKYLSQFTNPFDKFDDYLEIPPEKTGKNIHTYIDFEQSGVITDYLGNTAPYRELSGIHLEPTGFTLSLASVFINYLRGIKFKK